MILNAVPPFGNCRVVVRGVPDGVWTRASASAEDAPCTTLDIRVVLIFAVILADGMFASISVLVSVPPVWPTLLPTVALPVPNLPIDVLRRMSGKLKVV